MSPILIIGYGNPLRGDDGVGPIVVSNLSGLHPGVECVSTMQLHPEHAELMRGRNVVLFVDASIDAGSVAVARVEEETSAQWQAGHTDSPAGLAAFCRAMYPDPPERVFLLEIPACSFAFGEHLTPQTRRHANAAETLIRQLIPEFHHASASSNPIGSR
jgi:hydrogenase maturation protease